MICTMPYVKTSRYKHAYVQYTFAHRIVAAVEADRFAVELRPVDFGGCQEQMGRVRHGSAPESREVYAEREENDVHTYARHNHV